MVSLSCFGGRMGLPRRADRKPRSVALLPCLPVLAAAVATLLLAGCVSPWDPGRARTPTKDATPFDVVLMETYADLAAENFDQGDQRDADFFLGRAATAAQGGKVTPLDPARFHLRPSARTEADDFHDRLTSVLGRDGRTRAPEETAKAQAFLDCFVDAREEDPDDVSARDCLRRLTGALEAAEAEVSKRRLLVVVLPEADGKVGAVRVNYGTGASQLLDDAHAAVQVDDAGDKEDVAITANDVSDIFKDTLAARPKIPSHFTLYFTAGTDELTPDSRAQIDDIYAEVQSREAFEVEVIGHTDAQGPTSVNSRLSLERAEAIREMLVSRGVSPDDIVATGRGELEPAVADAGSAEPLNRRVEITVR